MYNELESIEDSVEEISIIGNSISKDYEVIIADDGSTDGSAEISDRLARINSHVKVVHLLSNTKFGGALRAGLKAATKELIIYTDSDLPVSFLDIKKSLLLIDEADIVTATSIIKKGENRRRRIISKVYNLLVQSLFKMDIKDANSGYKIYRKSVLEGMELKSESPFIDVEIFLKAKKNGARIVEYPLVFRLRRQGSSKISRMSVILKTFLDMLRCKFSR
ncbi:MAG: glycosyltransferase family 2 protein [Candidatus Omnitrophica bacterium]|nr:glycosyltransferase family 2 protein [Candidatus Omnitrophota bacterium]